MTDEPPTPAPAAGFTEAADIHTSSPEYAARFSGAIGRWMLARQEHITRRFLKQTPHASILDVGGGHGQLAVPLCQSGENVTVLGSDASCALLLEPALQTGRCRFVEGNVLEMPFADDSFDVVLCFRLLMHCTHWPDLVKELCRVAKYAVIVDYPTSRSFNRFADMFFGAKKKIEKNTRTWELFPPGRLENEFAQCGFGNAKAQKQFFWPMVLHRMAKCPAFSTACEVPARALGLTRLFGSPVIAAFTPSNPPP